MGPQEQEIWDRFLVKYGHRFLRFEYDVRVGPGYDPGPRYPDYLRKMAISLTQLRIDAVGYTEEEIWIFEVKPRAGRSMLRQLLSYGYWYLKQYNPAKPVRLAGVCERIDPNMVEVFRQRGIEIFLV